VDGVLTIVAILALAWLALVVALIVFGKRALAREVASLVPNLTRLFTGLVGDPRVPLRAKVVLGATALYLAMPIDLVPDFIPVAGQLDDAIVAAFALRYVIGTTPREVVAEHWRGDPETLRRILALARA
jgi:uncharacterized membrane protein YkvA (DUF1232 family)